MLTKEEREERKAQKQAERERREVEELRRVLDKFGAGSLSDPEDINRALDIIQYLGGSHLLEISNQLGGFGGGPERTSLILQVRYQHALLEQNFMIIRQLERILEKLDKD